MRSRIILALIAVAGLAVYAAGWPIAGFLLGGIAVVGINA